MGTNCDLLLDDLLLYSYEDKFLDNMIRSGHRRFARSFNQLCCRYNDDLIVFNNEKFWITSKRYIHPSWLLRKLTNQITWQTTLISHSSWTMEVSFHPDKRDDFDFQIVNFSFLFSNIHSGPSYGVYISQLIRYARCCSHYDDFRYCHMQVPGWSTSVTRLYSLEAWRNFMAISLRNARGRSR